MKKRGLTNIEIGDELGVSNASVWKRLKKLSQNQLSSSQVPAVGSPGRTVNAQAVGSIPTLRANFT